MHAKRPLPAEAPVQADPPARCSLDRDGVRRQLARYRRLARSVEQMRRDDGRLVVDFAADLDRRTLRRALAVERECCPFLSFSFDRRTRRLRASVSDVRFAPALEAISASLSACEASLQ